MHNFLQWNCLEGIYWFKTYKVDRTKVKVKGLWENQEVNLRVNKPIQDKVNADAPLCPNQPDPAWNKEINPHLINRQDGNGKWKMVSHDPGIHQPVDSSHQPWPLPASSPAPCVPTPPQGLVIWSSTRWFIVGRNPSCVISVSTQPHSPIIWRSTSGFTAVRSHSNVNSAISYFHTYIT